jgi:threonine synthase
MMTTPTEPNVHAIAIEGTFDDAQSLVKGLFNDHAFRDRVHLSGVNSINWARIVAQATYYFVAASALGGPLREVSFVVPTGNFADIFAGYVAAQMGLPIANLVIASNANDILPRTVATGRYEMRDVKATSSPSMDIQISSNFERYLFEASGCDAAVVRGHMGALKQSGSFDLGALTPTLQKHFKAASASEAEVADAIRRTQSEAGYLVDPHTACGLVAADKTLERKGGPAQIILATAHPAKFPDAIETITGHRPALPERLSSLMTDPERFEVLPCELGAIERYIEGAARALAKA